MKRIAVSEKRKALFIDSPLLKEGALQVWSLNHKFRIKILMLLHDKGQMIVTDIYKKFGLPQSQASQQLAILRRAGYVIAERDGNNIYYSVNYKRIKEVQQLIGKLLH